ncbi:TetR/AcrR family transcriptional regulator [Ruegeria sp. ANG-S4]|uniref:TetR/AcrR family transcriptional regulator n=1 Tax=Ruegeria sp. ANG-S4 TaxID=1577904 RepID=UPI00068F64A5|nr:TetR/AcrR family transcriptional regulator [Ruegeria sp. ANG-S4]
MDKQNDPRAGYLTIAAKQFAANGYHGVSLAALAEEAGVSKQALLHFFGTKQRLYSEVLSGLASRQLTEIESAKQADPMMHLKVYFNRFLASNLSRPDDARLTVRALLDVHENARVWPMKAYLDRLLEISSRTPVGLSAGQSDLQARVFHVIGAVQYFAISLDAISGMYGKANAKKLAGSFSHQISDTLDNLLGADNATDTPSK